MAELLKHRNIFLDDEDEMAAKIERHEKSWDDFGLKAPLVRGIYAAGFEKPSFIQKEAVPIISKGLDLRAQAQSGTGKTGAFVIGILQQIDEKLRATQALILAPTREIAQQNCDNLMRIGKYMDISIHLVSGGKKDILIDKQALGTRPQIIVGTPGRVIHMLEEKALFTEHIKIFVLDEADEMLNEGFLESIKTVYNHLKSARVQTLLFSATYGEADINLSRDMLVDPAVIDLRNEEQTLQGIKQVYVDIGSVEGRDFHSMRKQEVELKAATLIDIFKNQTISQMMIFMDRKVDATRIHEILNDNGYPCKVITSDLSQEVRDQTIEEFKQGKHRILVSSGLCKRGLDIQALSVVVCLDVPRPSSRSDFIHRVGRSGRYGRKGLALHILTHEEVDQLQEIAAHFNSVIQPLQANFNFKE